MGVNRVSSALTDNDRAEIMSAIATIREKLPFLIDLSADERKSLTKMGDKSRAFVAKALEVATLNPDSLPRSLDIDEMRKDVQLYEQLYPIVVSLSQLQELVNNTAMATGSEAMTAALLVYRHAKASGQSAGLEGIVSEMGQRFARKPRKTQTEAPTT